MPRFPAPLDDFETDDFTIPTFEAPPRRAARPQTSRSQTSRTEGRGTEGRGEAPRRSSARPATNRAARDDFDAAFDALAKNQTPRPSSLNRAVEPKRPDAKRPEAKRPAPLAARPKTPQGARRELAPPLKTAPRPRSPRALRRVHFQIGGVLLLAFGGLLGWNAFQSAPDGVLPRLILAGLRPAFGIGALVLPLGMMGLGALLLVKREMNWRAIGRGMSCGFLTLLTAAHLFVAKGAEFASTAVIQTHGGYVGGALAWLMRRALGEVGAIVALSALAIVALLLWSENTLGQLGTRWSERWRHWSARVGRERAARRLAKSEKQEQGRASRFGRNKDENEDEWDAPAEFESALSMQNAPEMRAPGRVLPPEIGREAQEARAPRLSPFLPVEAVIAAREKGVPAASAPVAPAEFPNQPAPAIDPNSSLDDPQFLDASTALVAAAPIAVAPVTAAPIAAAQVAAAPVAAAPVAVKAAATPAKAKAAPAPDFPKIEILDAPPPPSVVDAVEIPSARQSADEELTPVESLEKQAEESATEGESSPPAVLRHPKSNLPRRSFGDGPLMPTYFDPAVRALDPPVPPDNAGAEEEIQRGVAGVQETLAAFKIDAHVTDVKRGPVITRYEVQPRAGVRVSAIASLDKDLARSLSALAVRIEAPVPGKNVVGIEIPNKKVHLVRMRDVLEQPDFLAHPSKLAFVLGKDIAGQPKWGDLTKMPHMLIAGSTNSGKSVCLNSIIASILVRAQPDEVRFSLIDPKRVELTLYRGIKHLMHDVVVEPKQAVIALRRAIEEMDRRYKLFSARGVRNIVSFNSKLNEGEKPLPYIVIVIDELADLMMTAAAEFEKLICRLAQLARATGIHLIVATQRPSVNVITGVIKANIPARIAFAVASQVDSRTILDAVGAERLIGSGDMLYDSNNGGKSTRIQGAFLSEEEVNRIVEVVKAAYTFEEDTPDDLPTFDLYSEDSEDDFATEKPSGDEKRDVLYDEIKEFVARHQEMSASLIQRKFEIGYPRAGRIVDHLERDGILGPADGPKPRKVLGRSVE